MKKLISPSEWLMLGLAGLLDFIEEVRDPFHLFENYYSTYYGFVPNKYKRSHFSKLVWRNLKTGNITKVIEKGNVYFELTGDGKEKVKRKFPLLNLQTSIWDRIWRLVIFDIEEVNRRVRNLFRRKLKELGFGMLQKSVWISPYDFLGDFKEFVESHSLEKEVILLESKHIFIKDLKDLACKLWRIDEINDFYRIIYKELNDFKVLKKDDDRVKVLETIREKIIYVFLKDPHLPEEFLPVDWMGKKVKLKIREEKIFNVLKL